MEQLWYFAYGSNMSGAVFAGRRGMCPLGSRRGRLAGYRLCFNIPVGPGERGVANIELHPDACIDGVLYLVTSADAERLDRSEGVHVGVYRRVAVTVAPADDPPVTAFTYQSDLILPGRKPSARYMGLLLDGARQHGLAATYVDFLGSFELAHDERLQQG